MAAKRNRIILWSIVIASVIVLGALSHSISLKTIHAWSAEINGWLLFAIMAFLPLIGMPMSLLAIMAGAKFGPWEGMEISAATVSINLAASWWIARSWLRRPLEKLLRKTNYKRPTLEKGEYIGVCLLTALVPGPSYTIKNYFLAISNLPFRVIFWVGLPAHLFAMSPGLLFGDFSGKMTTAKGVFLVTYTLLLIGASHFLIRRIRRRRRSRAKNNLSGIPHR
ncbi:MAG TPA: VTT domain-containing protein [Verrucomicrobiae bacterium]|nr:VTT domain-containing protein [Verrucomicrobiae bacterium]